MEAAITPQAAVVSVGAVVVSHQSAEQLGSCIEALTRDPRVEVVVVDNASSDGSAAVAEGLGAHVVPLSRNTGFAFACNVGARSLARSHPWVAFVNPDVSLDGSDLVRMAADAPADIASLSPLLVDEEGTPQRDIARPEPKMGQLVLRYLLTWRAEAAAVRMYRRLTQGAARYFPTEVTSGACLLIRKETFDRIVGFREEYFFNGDDIDLSCRVRWSGGTVAVDRAVEARHRKGTSSARVSTEARALECARTDVLFFELYRPFLETLVVAVAVFLGCLMRGGLARIRRRPAEPALPGVRTYVALARELRGSVARRLRHVPPPCPADPVFL